MMPAAKDQPLSKAKHILQPGILSSRGTVTLLACSTLLRHHQQYGVSPIIGMRVSQFYSCNLANAFQSLF